MVNAANAVIKNGTASDIRNGLKVEAEGTVSNGVLVASRLVAGLRLAGRRVRGRCHGILAREGLGARDVERLGVVTRSRGVGGVRPGRSGRRGRGVDGHRRPELLGPLGAVAVLWNPVFPIELGQAELWLALQYVAAAVFIAAGILIKTVDNSATAKR